MNDTSPEIRKRFHEMLLAKSPVERLRMVSRMLDSAKKLALSGMLKERPYLDSLGLSRDLFLRIYGNDFSIAEREQIIKKIAGRSSA